MERFRKTHKKLLSLSMLFSVLSSLSLMAATLVNTEGKYQAPLLIGGLAFWATLILEQVFLWKANGLRKKALAKEKKRNRGKAGIFAFCQNPKAKAADLALGLCLVALAVCLIFGLGRELIQYVLICLTVLSFRMHCFLNGKNYTYQNS